MGLQIISARTLSLVYSDWDMLGDGTATANGLLVYFLNRWSNMAKLLIVDTFGTSCNVL
jgi:hypothetical protein